MSHLKMGSELCIDETKSNSGRKKKASLGNDSPIGHVQPRAGRGRR
jgi:hypothetical protein